MSAFAFTRLLRAKLPLPWTKAVTSARYDWLLSNPQQLGDDVPMLVPVMLCPANLMLALTFADPSGGPFQYRTACLTVPDTPDSAIVPAPVVPRRPPSPAQATSVLNCVVSGWMSFAWATLTVVTHADAARSATPAAMAALKR